jgi:hypothetical protein
MNFSIIVQAVLASARRGGASMEAIGCHNLVTCEILDLIGRNEIPWDEPRLCDKVLTTLEGFILAEGQDWIKQNPDRARRIVRLSVLVNRGGWWGA